MTTEPWSKFYWADWRSDPKLRMCSLGARGLWMELLSLMHSSDEFAHLLVNGNSPTEQQLAILCGASANEIRKLKAELALAGVPGIREDGVWFSRRMVRDKEKRLRDKANGAKGGNPNVKGTVNVGVNPPENPSPPHEVNDWDKARGTRDPEARSQKPEREPTPDGVGTHAPKGPAPHRMSFGEIPPEWEQWAMCEKGWDSSVIADVWCQFRDHWQVGKGKSVKRRGWDATWRTWCRKENYSQSGGSNENPQRRASTGGGYSGGGGGSKTDRAKAAVLRAAVAGGYAAQRQPGETGTGDDAVPVLSGAESLG